jgi:hypothetical protein
VERNKLILNLQHLALTISTVIEMLNKQSAYTESAGQGIAFVETCVVAKYFSNFTGYERATLSLSGATNTF